MIYSKERREEEAQALLRGHPRLGWVEGREIEVHESLPLPGQHFHPFLERYLEYSAGPTTDTSIRRRVFRPTLMGGVWGNCLAVLQGCKIYQFVLETPGISDKVRERTSIASIRLC